VFASPLQLVIQAVLCLCLFRLETKWILWHDFMKEHADLDAWLRLAEQAVTSANITCLTYLSAKEELRKFERVRVEAGSRLVQLDSLTRRNRTLTRLFQGVMQTRLLASAKDCGRRWDDVSAKLESITGRLKLFVSEWEGFEAEREELALWLADLNVRLTEVDQLNGSSCEKLQQLQVCVCVRACVRARVCVRDFLCDCVCPTKHPTSCLNTYLSGHVCSPSSSVCA
uniref:Uncharacterized LOC113123808 n=1 Tax=Mastacembelus armatus TaxID=205130 RepID=A0A3Q3NB05_9TELE